MIIIFGGTTEGRIAAKVLDEAGSPYYYSTRGNAQQIECKHGICVTGGLDSNAMLEFCTTHDIRLIIDAAHPFASLLHSTVASVSEQLDIPVIRLERRYPPRDESLVWCDSFDDAIDYLESHEINHLLALSGVQTIGKLRRYWEKHACHFRVLDREDSRTLAKQTGFPEKNLLFWHEGQDELALFRQLHPGAILTKESGESGYYRGKGYRCPPARHPGNRHPPPPPPGVSFYTVNGEHGLRYHVERLLPGFYPLRSGFTTGSCATAATRAALRGLLTRETQHSATITLPDGETVTLPVSSCVFTDSNCTCGVIKDAGDDPDVTNGYTVLSTVSLTTQPGIQFLPGEGVGTITLPGIGIPIGEPAINQTPRRMITNEIEQLLHSHGLHSGVSVRISVPGGSELAKKTFNPRLGITGGISIIGTSGIVRPFSSEAFVNSIRKEIQVARALGCPGIVINSGQKVKIISVPAFPISRHKRSFTTVTTSEIRFALPTRKASPILPWES